MKNLKTISLYKISLLIIISILFSNLYVCLIISIYLFLSNKKECLIYLLFILFIYFLTNNYNDFIKIGIVIQKKNKFYVVDKLLYKTKLYTTDNLNFGDIIYTLNNERYSDDLNINNNYLFNTDSYKYLTNIKIKRLIYENINNFKKETSEIIKKIIYFENSYDSVYLNIINNLSIYIYIRNIKNKKIQTIIIILYSLLFCFNLKFLYILLINLYKRIDEENYSYLTILTLLLINDHLIYNYSLVIPIIFAYLKKLNINLSFKTILVFIDSLLFNEINIIYIFLYKYIIKINFYLIIFSFILLIIPNLENLYLNIFNLFLNLSNNLFIIRGKLSIIGLIIYLLLYKLFNIREIYNIILICLILISPFNHPFMSVDFIDVGQGDAILIHYPFNLANVLIDTGSTYNYSKLKNYLLAKGIYSLDYLIITHMDNDHSGNIDNLNDDFKINNIIYEGKDINYKKLEFKYLYLTNNGNENDESLVYCLNINGLDFLFTGDISTNVEKTLINKYNLKDIDVLKVSHHGSKSASSDYFISHLNPTYAIISTSGQYNHPSLEVLETLNKYSVNTFITKDDKNIIFYITNLFKLIKYDNSSFVIIKK